MMQPSGRPLRRNPDYYHTDDGTQASGVSPEPYWRRTEPKKNRGGQVIVPTVKRDRVPVQSKVDSGLYLRFRRMIYV